MYTLTVKARIKLRGGAPTNSVLYYSLHVLVVEGFAGLVTGVEIEYLSKTSCKRATASKYVSILIPGGKKKVIRLGNVERLTIHFLNKLKMRGNSFGYWMRGGYVPQNSLLISSPHKISGSSENGFERL